MAKAKQKSPVKAKKKKWLPIHAPKEFNEVTLGETYVQEPSEAKGKHLTINLMSLTRDIKKQHISLSFEITDVSADKAKTKLVRIHISPSFIKRMVRRRRDRIDDSFVIKTKDGVKLRIKPMLITRSNTSNTVQSAIRKKAAMLIIKKAESMTAESLMDAVVNYRLQKDIRQALSKIHPIRSCEIRDLRIESEKKARRAKLRKVSEEEPDEEEDDYPEDEAAAEQEVPAEKQEETEKEADRAEEDAEKDEGPEQENAQQKEEQPDEKKDK